MTDQILATREDGVLTVQLNRPERRNALTSSMIRSLGQTLGEAVPDPSLRVLVLRGAGRDFCTGVDLDEFYRSVDAPEDRHREESERMADIFRALYSLRVPTVAVVQGRALGVGATLAVSCDAVFASSATQIGFPDINYGFLPAFATAVVSRLTGRKAAFDLLGTGRCVKADEALALGLVSRVIPDEGFLAVTGSCLRSLCGSAPELLLEFKRFFEQSDGKPIGEALELAAAANARARVSAAFRDAAQQFLAMT